MKYDLAYFESHNQPFQIRIGNCTFSENGIDIDLNDNGFRIRGVLTYTKSELYREIVIDNIMGPFKYIKHLECNHGLVSMSRYISGTLAIGAKDVLFKQGKGYMEKDWGKSFPKDYSWIQCNHFNNPDISLFCSVAHIPFGLFSFKGYLCTLIDKKEYRFATYIKGKAKTRIHSGNILKVRLTNKNFTLFIHARTEQSAQLIAPNRKGMKSNIKEGISGIVKIRLYSEGKLLLKDHGTNAGIEIVV
ncbi:MAG: hypothetical protein JXQ23_08250 [Clostridia bacterium]|nr:hypothetical protein [Clostridia bacterium]